MSSAKRTANRRLIVRLGVVVAVLAVLAASCSQSEDRVSDESEPAASTSQAGLSSPSPSSSAAENPASSSSPSVLDTATTLVPAEEQSSGSGSEIATTTTSLLSSVTEVVVSEEVVELIDVAVDACADLYELRCGVALGDLCFLFRSGDDIILTGGEQSDICHLNDVVQSFEVDAVLSAKYGEEYYRWNPGLLAFRGGFNGFTSGYDLSSFNNFSVNETDVGDEPRIGQFESFDEFVDESIWGEFLPDAVRLKLLRIVYDFGSALRLRYNNISLSPKSEDTSSRILSAPDFPEAYRDCYESGIDGYIKASLAEMLTSAPERQELRTAWDLEVFVCFDALCASSEAGDAVVCYFEDGDKDEFELSSGRRFSSSRSGTVNGFFWNSMKYFCAKGTENNNAFPNDICHEVAANICEIIRKTELVEIISTNDEYSNLLISWRLESFTCGLSSPLYYQAFDDAKARCYSEIANLLKTMDLLFVQDSSCNDASVECTEFWQRYRQRYFPIYYENIYPRDVCSQFREYYAFEVFWQTIPTICSKSNTSSSEFAGSECYNSIQRFCNSRYGEVSFEVSFGRQSAFAIYYRSPIKTGTQIKEALCSIILDTPTQISVNTNSYQRYLNLTPHESQKTQIQIDIDPDDPGARTSRAELTVQFTDDNIDNINSAVQECTNNSFAPNESKCTIELWKSCLDLLSYKTSSQALYFDAYYRVDASQEFWHSITYICDAAWIAELIRIATILAASFPEDYQAGNFNQFIQYTLNEAVDRGEGILTIDENGTAQPNVDQENLRPELAESLTAVGTSMAQIIQPYLPPPNANQQADA